MPGGVAGAQREGGGAFGGGGEPHQLREGERVGVGGDVAQHAAGGDRGELAVVADQAHAGAAGQGVVDDRVEVEGAGLAGLVDDDQRVVVDAVEPGGVSAGGPGRSRWTYLATVSVGAPGLSPSSMAAAAVGAKPRTLPPEERHACDSAAIAVVLPVPAGASASATRRPLVAISATSATWPGLRVLPRAAESAQRQLDIVPRDAAATCAGGGGEDAPFGGQRSRPRCTAAVPWRV